MITSVTRIGMIKTGDRSGGITPAMTCLIMICPGLNTTRIKPLVMTTGLLLPSTETANSVRYVNRTSRENYSFCSSLLCLSSRIVRFDDFVALLFVYTGVHCRLL